MNELFTPFSRSGSNKLTIKNESMKVVRAPDIFCYVLALVWEKRQLEAGIMQE